MIIRYIFLLIFISGTATASCYISYRAIQPVLSRMEQAARLAYLSSETTKLQMDRLAIVLDTLGANNDLDSLEIAEMNSRLRDLEKSHDYQTPVDYSRHTVRTSRH